MLIKRNTHNDELFSKLKETLLEIKDPLIAVSGGVDSTTLSSFAHRVLGREKVRMVHAVSPAVPKAATERTRNLADLEGWNFHYLDAGEFSDPRYRSNPINRCFFCKSNLYEALSRFSHGTIISGTNLDDLQDVRPGLKAAEIFNVRHPYVEAKLRKSDLRALARLLGLDSLASLPASPCLSSRVETGIRIKPSDLNAIDSMETWIRKKFHPKIVRCRLLSNSVSIELDNTILSKINPIEKETIKDEAVKRFPQFRNLIVTIKGYKRGSAFVKTKSVLPNG